MDVDEAKKRFEEAKLMFGEKIKYHRTENKWSLQRLADEANLEKATLHRIEKGKINFTFKTILSIADALGIPPSDLFQT